MANVNGVDGVATLFKRLFYTPKPELWKLNGNPCCSNKGPDPSSKIDLLILLNV